MKRVWFMRHGQAEHNMSNFFTDDDTALTEVGRRQVVAAAQQLKQLEQPIDAIVASTARRTQQTAEIVAKELGFPSENIQSDARLGELVYGGFVGTPHTPANRRLRNQHFLTKNNPVKLEWIGDVATRLESFAEDLVTMPQDTILIVGHGMSGRMLRRILGDQDHTKPMLRVQPAEILQVYPYVEDDPKSERVL